LSIFVDDGRVSGVGREETWEKFQFVLTVLQLAGWNIQFKKTSTSAEQRLQHLGFITDSVQIRYFLPVEKEVLVRELLVQTVQQACEGRQGYRRWSWLGSWVSSIPCVGRMVR